MTQAPQMKMAAAAASAAGHDGVSAAKLVAELVQTGSMELYDGATTAVPEADRLDFVCEVRLRRASSEQLRATAGRCL